MQRVHAIGRAVRKGRKLGGLRYGLTFGRRWHCRTMTLVEVGEGSAADHRGSGPRYRLAHASHHKNSPQRLAWD